VTSCNPVFLVFALLVALHCYYAPARRKGLDAKAHVGLLDRLHVARKNNTKIETIYNHM